MHIYCSKQHANTNGNRFCIQCGESLPLPQGEIITGRYKILHQLGQGGFGRTYLAEDSQLNQMCVLKEFAPQVEKPEDIQKAKELFEREANVLKKLQHSQIPKFHASLSTKFGQKDFFFLVQDYIEGDTYWDLLDKRLSYGQNGFSEEEIISLLKQMLPVLHYIHSRDVIHRDISPDNIILRSSDNLPVLIDFGGVKQVPASQGFWMTQLGANRTLLGKKGYAPEEQLRQGKAFPCSDLYSLVVSALVLLTGKEPQNLYDSYQGTWRWGTDIKVSQGLEKILKKTLAYKPSDRYQNAEQLIKDLQKLSPASAPAVNKANTNITKIKTMIAAPARRAGNLHSRTQMAVHALPLPVWMRPFAVSAVTTTGIVLVCAGTWGVVNAVVKGVSSISLPSISLPSLPGGGNSDSSSETTTNTGSNGASRNSNIASRRASLQIPEGFFTQTVNYIFYSKNPQLQGKSIGTGAEDEALRQQWVSIGQDLLDKLEQAKLSSTARQKLGSYGGQDYQNWEQRALSGDFGNYTIKQLNNDTNRKFDDLFPGQRRGKLNQPTFGQIWYAIAADKVSKLESK